ncbi:MAG: hypothetical protein QXE05_05415 [Nitrososphaeria archaeon]
MLRKYYSGYIESSGNIETNKVYIGKFFSISFDIPRPDRRNSFIVESGTEGNTVIKQFKEAIIQTSNLENAVKASELIGAALNLITGSVILYNGLPTILPLSGELSREEKELLTELIFGVTDPELGEVGKGIITIEGVLEACKIACKASFRKTYRIALLKYQLGNYLCPVDVIDVNPFHSPYYKISPFLFDHVRLAYVIIAFYSVIEELGLEVRASTENPSFRGGRWNPTNRKELESRLKKAGLNQYELIVWNLRSTPTRIERYLRNQGKLKPISKTSWSKGSVRDCEIELIDAIAIVSNLRSSVSSHRFKESVESLSIYDVSNANYLARRLLLQRLGFWKPKSNTI